MATSLENKMADQMDDILKYIKGMVTVGRYDFEVRGYTTRNDSTMVTARRLFIEEPSKQDIIIDEIDDTKPLEAYLPSEMHDEVHVLLLPEVHVNIKVLIPKGSLIEQRSLADGFKLVDANLNFLDISFEIGHYTLNWMCILIERESS